MTPLRVRRSSETAPRRERCAGRQSYPFLIGANRTASVSFTFPIVGIVPPGDCTLAVSATGAAGTSSAQATITIVEQRPWSGAPAGGIVTPMADVGAPLDRFDEVETGEAFTQNSRLLKVEPAEASRLASWARAGCSPSPQRAGSSRSGEA